MEARQALADLTEISAQIQAAVILERSGDVVASTLGDEQRASRLARGALDLFSAAEGLGEEGRSLTQLDASTPEGNVFVVREGERLIAATTRPEPTVGLVYYDLKSCLRTASKAAEAEAPRRTRRKKEDDAAS